MVLDLQLDPVLVRWDDVLITWNSVCTALALFVGTLIALRSLDRAHVSRTAAGYAACWVLLGGFVGNRTVHMLAHVAYGLAMPRELLEMSDGSGSIVGALLGGWLALLGVARMLNIERSVLLNAAVPSALLCAPIHLFGNLLTGAGWGPPTGGAWGVSYWHPGAFVPPHLISVPLHPLPLYQIVVFVVLLVLWTLLRDRAAPGWRLGQEVC